MCEKVTNHLVAKLVLSEFLALLTALTVDSYTVWMLNTTKFTPFVSVADSSVDSMRGTSRIEA